MKILLDTHAFLWAMAQPNKLSEQASKAIISAKNQVFLSAASYWEICIKLSLGKLNLVSDWQALYDKEMQVNLIRWHAIEKAHCVQIIDLPAHHKDPFDRLIIAQAMTDGMSIVSADKMFSQYDVDVIW